MKDQNFVLVHTNLLPQLIIVRYCIKTIDETIDDFVDVFCPSLFNVNTHFSNFLFETKCLHSKTVTHIKWL